MDRDIMSRGNLAVYEIDVYDNGKKVGNYVGSVEAARALGCSKQAVCSALKGGHLCKGYHLVARKSDGRKPYHSLEEARKAPFRKQISERLDIPDSIYSETLIDITPEAVF